MSKEKQTNELLEDILDEISELNEFMQKAFGSRISPS